MGVGEMRLSNDGHQVSGSGLTMEDEMNLDGAVISASFDDTMDLVMNI